MFGFETENIQVSETIQTNHSTSAEINKRLCMQDIAFEHFSFRFGHNRWETRAHNVGTL